MNRAIKILITTLVVLVIALMITLVITNDNNYKRVYNDEPSFNYFEEDLEDKVYSRDVIVTDVDKSKDICYVFFYVSDRQGSYIAEYKIQQQSILRYSWSYKNMIYYLEK